MFKCIFFFSRKEKNEKAISSSWENDLSSITQDLSQNKCIASDESEVNKDLNDAFEKDLEFIKKHAINADPKFLRLLLNSQSNNPNRLEMVCEILNLPNALETLKEPRKYSNDKKRSVNNIDSEAAERKKKRSDDTENYLNQITDMFPDADRLFLISECQHIKNWEDYSRFINTVMISGVYPKKEAVDYSSQKLFSNVGNAFNDQAYRVIYSSSEEEISSTDSSDLKKRKKKNTKKTVDIISIDSPELLKKKLKNPTYVSAVIDITDNDDDTESSNLPNENLEILHNKSPINKSTMEIDEASPDWTTSLDDDIDYLFQKKFRTHFLEKTNKVNLESSENLDAGLSNLSTPNTSFRFSLPSNSTLNIEDSEKSLAEIIEEKRPNRRLSLDSQNHLHNDFSKPSTSKVNDSDKTKMETVSENNVSVSSVSEVHLDELSFAKVSTTCQNDDSGNFIANETDEVSKIKEDWLDEQTANLIRIFPNTDPSYLRVEVMKMNMSSEAVNAFVVAKLENNNMPTRAEYEKRLEMEELQNRYTKNFSIEDFVKVLPDPWRYFSQGNRNCIKYKKHSLCYLKSAFKKHYVRDIIHVFNENNFNLFLTYKTLKKRETRMRGKRSEFECNNHRPTTINIQFLQEVSYLIIITFIRLKWVVLLIS